MEHPRRRLGATVLILTQAGDKVLLVHPTYREGWILPGGGADPGESVSEAARREVQEELGLSLVVTHGLTEDQVPADAVTGSPEGINIVCDGGRMTPEDAAALSLPVTAAGELRALAWVPLDQLSDYCEPFMERRVRAAVAAAVRNCRFPLLYEGRPAIA
ncbi:NUDIX domain-containing protein [Kitasatospora sp. NPDC015120]|uniref:NUDIX domain-containing protein n=1 Tax=Kitasatospora sp. NPDC015120 TaxID=3364023 RepID=UPI0036F47E7B